VKPLKDKLAEAIVDELCMERDEWLSFPPGYNLDVDLDWNVMANIVKRVIAEEQDQLLIDYIEGKR
jgi:hypothetical protein